MRVLAGGPARETTSPVFDLHRRGLEVQGGWGHTRTEDQVEVVTRWDIVPDPGGERWNGEKIERVARVRERFLELAEADRFDGLLMVDTDVILGPGVLRRMMAVDADVVYGVFWTEADWGRAPGVTEWPQVWDVHPYGFHEHTFGALNRRDDKGRRVEAEVPVLGGGACTLIRGRGFESSYWPLLESIRYCGGMWGGEDRTFALGLEARGIQQVAVTGLPIFHCYTAALQTPEGLERAREEVGL